MSRPSLKERARAWPWPRIAYGLFLLVAVGSFLSDVQTLSHREGMTTFTRSSAMVGSGLMVVTLGLALRHPRWAVVAGLGSMAAALAAWYLPPGLFALVFAVFATAMAADLALAAVFGVGIAIWTGAAGYLRPHVFTDLLWLLSLVIFLPAGFGWALGVARRRREEAERRASSLEGQATAVREQERRILARELHDVVAHGLTLISMQATVMRIATQPEQVETARAAIERSSRDSLDELKRLLKVLRASDVITDETSALREASVDDGAGLPELVERLADDLRGVGHTVEVVCDVGAVPQSVALAADRVLREGVTNIVKHGGAGTTCTLSVREVTSRLEIDVANDVRSERLADLGSTRLGIVGLAERIELLGGSLDAGLDRGHWRVRVRLPLT